MMMPATLPEIFRPLLWSYRFERIDPAKHKKTVVLQAINYGSLEHWRWLARTYGADAVRQVLRDAPASATRPQARRLAALLFGAEHPRYASRSAH